VPRTQPGAVIEDPERVAERVATLARERRLLSVEGSPVAVSADTVCLHGDTPGAVELAAAIRGRLDREGVAVRSLAR